MKQLNISGYKKVALGLSLVIIAACGKDEVQKPDYPAVQYYVSAQNMSTRQVSYTISGNKTVHLSLATPEHKVSPFSFDTTTSKYISITASGIADSTGFWYHKRWHYCKQ